MAAGPYENLLRQAVTPMQHWDVQSSDAAWARSAQNLENARRDLARAATAMRKAFGNQSNVGERGHAAFTHAATRAEERSTQMAAAADAIKQANQAMTKAQSDYSSLGAEPSHPGA